MRACVNDIVDSPMGIQAKQQILVRAEILAGLTFDGETIERIFREVETMFDIERSAGYQRILEKGIEKGIEKGKKELAIDMATRLLRRKFERIPSGYLEEIKSQELSTLERIAENIFDIEKPEDLDRYLS